jgi:hypothetical protein
MKEDFIRPALDAITSADELTVGTKLWHVFGIWFPFVDAREYTVVRAPLRYDRHPDKRHPYAHDSLVFDVYDGKHISMEFASDGNIGSHHNNNYWFKSKASAETYRAQCHQDWIDHPEEIDRVQARRRQDAFDSLHDDFYDYERK